MRRVSVSAHQSQSRCDRVKLVRRMRSASLSVVEELSHIWNTMPISRACSSRKPSSSSGATSAANSRLAMVCHLPSWPRRSHTTMSRSPRSSSAAARLEPMKPAPPVMTIMGPRCLPLPRAAVYRLCRRRVKAACGRGSGRAALEFGQARAHIKETDRSGRRVPCVVRLDTAAEEATAMQTENRLLDDLARVATGALGALSGMRDEVEARMRDQFERILGRMNLVRREEFDAVQAMAAKARAAQEALEQRVALLEAKLTAGGDSAPPSRAAPSRSPQRKSKPTATPGRRRFAVCAKFRSCAACQPQAGYMLW